MNYFYNLKDVQTTQRTFHFCHVITFFYIVCCLWKYPECRQTVLKEIWKKWHAARTVGNNQTMQMDKSSIYKWYNILDKKKQSKQTQSESIVIPFGSKCNSKRLSKLRLTVNLVCSKYNATWITLF